MLFAPDVRLDYNAWNTGINVANTALITGVSMAVVYSAAYLCAASLAVMALVEAWWLWRRADAADSGALPW